MNIDLPFTPSDHIYLFYNSETNISRAGQLIVRPGSIVHLDCIQVSKKNHKISIFLIKILFAEKKNCILIIKITILLIKIHKISIFLILILILILSSSLPKSYFPACQRSSQFCISSFHISASPICVSLCLWHSFLSFSQSLHLTLSHISAPPPVSLSFIWFKSNPIGSVPPLLDKVVSSIVILQLGPVGPPQNKPFSNSMEASRSLAMAIGLKMVSFLITQLVPGGHWQLSF